MKDVLSPTAERFSTNANEIATPATASKRFGIISLLAAALAVHLLVILAGADKGLFYPDEFEYIELAKNLAERNEFSYKGHLTSFRPPGFPFIVSLAFRFFGSEALVPARVLQMLFSLATIWIIYRLGRDGWGEKVGFIAAGIFAFYPTLIGFSNILLTEPACIFFVSLTCWAMLRYLQHSHLGWAFVAGAALGISALIRDTLFYAGPLTIFFLFVYNWRKPRAHLWHAAFLTAGFVSAILPWSIRNSLLNGQPTLISSVGGITFYLCNNEKAPLIRSSSLFYEKQIGEEYYYETLLPELDGLSETEKNEIVTRKAFEYMLANPGATLVRMLGRFVDFWGQERLVINHVLAKYYGDITQTGVIIIVAAVFGSYSLIMIGACFGCFFSKLRAFDVFGLLFIAYYTAMHLLVFAHPRYHMPLLPLLILMAARACASRNEITAKLKTWRFAGAAGLAAVFVIIWIVGLFVFDAKYLESFMQRLG